MTQGDEAESQCGTCSTSKGNIKERLGSEIFLVTLLSGLQEGLCHVQFVPTVQCQSFSLKEWSSYHSFSLFFKLMILNSSFWYTHSRRNLWSVIFASALDVSLLGWKASCQNLALSTLQHLANDL